MNIQRKYSLPNCTLILEGLTNPVNGAGISDLRPQLSILVNAECHLSGIPKPISGGREFFESLVVAVSSYAQEFLSQVRHPDAHNAESGLVQFQNLDKNRHRMTVQGGGKESSGTHSPTQIDLTTVQLFDLVEAVDQFFADSQTLPDLSLQLGPVSKSEAGTNTLVAKQAVPAAVGVSSLAAAAVAMALLPVPQVRPPQPNPQTNANTTTQSAATTPVSTANPTPAATTAPTPEAAATPTFSPTATPEATASPTPVAAATPAQQPPSVTDLEATLKATNEITDNNKLRDLSTKLYKQVNSNWQSRKELSEDLVFRVAVGSDGAIIGYKAVSQTANDGVAKTPLPNLVYNPATSSRTPGEEIAQYKVVFTKSGVLQVSPWWGYSR